MNEELAQEVLAGNVTPEGSKTKLHSSSAEAVVREALILDRRLNGSSIGDIAREFQISVAQTMAIMRSATYMAMARDTVESALALVRERFVLRAEAASTQVDNLMLRGENDRVKLAAAQDILDRADATNAVKKGGDNANVTIHINGGDLNLILETAQQLGTGHAPRVLEAIVQRQPVLPDPGDSWQEQADAILAQATGGLRPDDEGAPDA
jgi:hypothetical protein